MKNERMLLLFTLFIISFTNKNYAQINIGGEPYSFTRSISKTVEIKKMPKIDIQALIEEDKNTPEDTPYRFGYGFDVNYNLDNSGTWFKLDDGSKLWKLHIKSENAYSINLIYFEAVSLETNKHFTKSAKLLLVK